MLGIIHSEEMDRQAWTDQTGQTKAGQTSLDGLDGTEKPGQTRRDRQESRLACNFEDWHPLAVLTAQPPLNEYALPCAGVNMYLVYTCMHVCEIRPCDWSAVWMHAACGLCETDFHVRVCTHATSVCMRIRIAFVCTYMSYTQMTKL
jgi:hypothetical protein